MSLSKDANRPAAAGAKATPPPTVPPLFRKIDWLTMAATTFVTFIIYFLTIAPELTLQDSGELVTGSYYAGIPHPPGYPVWTMYSYLWTVLVPVGNIAWRVALGQVVAGSVACGLLALMVSRGSSMFMESIEELKQMTGQWESAICSVSGFVAGLLLGLDGFMWSESIVVNRISVFGVPWVLMLMICLLRWIYAPHQLRYTYWALFVFGVCLTIHQSLIVSVLAIQVCIAVCKPKLGRDVFALDGILYIIYNLILLTTGKHILANIGKPGTLFLFHVIGIGTLFACGWLAMRTQGLLSEWKPVLIMVGLLGLGVSFYFYMPITGMTNPPMQWGYPRTVEGFFHALTRGQYEQPNPTNLLADPGRFLGQLGMLVRGLAEEFGWVYIFIALVPFAFYLKMRKREQIWLITVTAFYFCQGVLLMILLNPSPERASADLVKVFFISSHMIVAGLVGYGLALVAAFMATQYARFRRWGLAGGAFAAVLAMLSLWGTVGTHFFGKGGKVGLADLPHWIGQAFAKDQYGLPIYAGLILIGLALVFVIALAVYRHRAPLAITLGIYGLMPLHPGLSHWFDSEQREHMFGYWFGHDMFTPPFKDTQGKPLYPEMTKDAILYGGTDPGRFCPTYIIFCESFTPHQCQPKEDQNFDRRDVYIITQNALADGTYLDYIRAHYNRSKQIDPPFFQELLRPTSERMEGYKTNIFAQMVKPLDRFFTALGDRVEKRRRTSTSLFTEKDFLDLNALTAKLRPAAGQDPLSKWLYENLSQQTQSLLTGGNAAPRLGSALAADLNVLLERELEIRKQLQALQGEKQNVDYKIAAGSTSSSLRAKQDRLTKEIEELSKVQPLYAPERFPAARLSPYLTKFVAENPKSHTRIRLNRLLLEEAYAGLIAKSLGGVYPDREIYIASVEDSQQCFNEYMADVQRRLQMDPPQKKPGEEVAIVDGKIQVTGQVAVMSINGLITKVIFDRNPDNEFFVEESYPIDWMYPHLTPFGIIMKINRQPLASIPEEVLQRDHVFWKEYSKRLTGDIIDYDTPIKDIVAWIEKTYLRHDFSGFRGDRKFVRDDEAQKAFSKLRSAIAGVYAWRLSGMAPPEYRPKTDGEFQRLLKEADFAFRQSFLFCPFSPEAVFRYINLLASQGRYDDAQLVAQTCLKFDPENRGIEDLVRQLQAIPRGTPVEPSAQQSQLQQLEQQFNTNPGNVSLAQSLIGLYQQMQQPGRAFEVLDKTVAALQGQYTTSPTNHSLALSIVALLNQRQRTAEATQMLNQVIGKLEAERGTNRPAPAQGMLLAQAYLQAHRENDMVVALDGVLQHTNLDGNTLVAAANMFNQVRAIGQVERAVTRLVQLEPERPEYWLDLARMQAAQGKQEEALKSLTQSLGLYRKQGKKAGGSGDLVAFAAQDPLFTPLKQNSNFVRLIQGK